MSSSSNSIIHDSALVAFAAMPSIGTQLNVLTEVTDSHHDFSPETTFCTDEEKPLPTICSKTVIMIEIALTSP